MAGNKMTTRQRYEPGLAVFTGPDVTYRIPYSGPVPMDYTAAVAAFDTRMDAIQAALDALLAARSEPLRAILVTPPGTSPEQIALLLAEIATPEPPA